MAKLWALFLVCIAPLVGADWEEVVQKECRHASDSDSFLHAGNVYIYRYHAVGSGAAVGTSDRSSEIQLDCSVAVRSEGGCLFSLEVSNCKVTAEGGPEGQKVAWIQDRELSEVAEYPVLFSLNNGRLGSVYAVPADTIASLNIKRGIISGFGISKSSADGEEKMHRDVHGTCPWTAEAHGSHYTSSKKMIFCRHPTRPDWHLSPWSLFWDMTFIQPLINSSAECEYIIDEAQSQLKKVSCHERHAIYLDSSEFTANAVQTNVRYLLELRDSRKEPFKRQYRVKDMRATGIELEYEATPEPHLQTPDFLPKAQKALSDVVLSSQEAVELRTIPLFHELVDILRKSVDIVPFVDTVTSCRFIEGVSRCSKHQKELGMAYLKDALVQCNTGPCMGGFRHLVVRDQVSRLYLTGTFLSLANIPITDPTYIEELFAMCKHTEMKVCWLALGTAIHKYSEEHSGVPQATKDTLAHLSSYLGEQCDVEDVTFPSHYTVDDKTEYLLTVIKTIGNIGEVARSEQGIVKQLFVCASKKDAPQEISVAAIKAVRRMKPHNYIRKKAALLLRDDQRSVGVRLAAYDILVKMFLDDELAKEIASLLSTERSTQVKCYIATDIERIRKESDEKDPESFAYKLLEQLKEGAVYLEDFQCSVFHHSSSYGMNYFFHLHFLPDDISRFGIEVDRKIVFDTVSAIPYSQTRNLTIELFSKLYNILETGVSAKNWEEFGIWVRRQLRDPSIQTGQWFVQNFIEVVRKLGIKGLIPVLPGTGEEEMKFVYPDQKIADNLKRLIKRFLQSHEKGKPSLEIYLKTFGNEVAYVTLNGLFSFLTNQYQWLSNQNLGEALRKGITYNVTRAFEVIEAYYHVPTLMGLSLNWQSKATYIISPRITIDAELETGERTENCYTDYSEAFTLHNSMILELPHITQIGVQANTSTCASVDNHLKVYVSDSKHLREITTRPSGKRQKYLEFYRTNQQIQHDEIKDIPDWSTERQEEKWCTSEKFGEISGFKFCRERSFPVLPFNMVTSTLMAGKSESRIYAEMVDRGLHEYKLTIIRPPIENGIYDLKLHFRAPSEKYKRDVKINLYVDWPNQEGKFDVEIPEVKDLVIKAARERHVNEDGVSTGVHHFWIIQLEEGRKYEMTYHLNEKTLSGPEVKASRKRGRQQKIATKVLENTVDLKTPHNIYHYEAELERREKNVKLKYLLTYENLEEEWKWPAEILADSLWETDKKAWIQFDADWETAYNPDTPDHFHRHTVNVLSSPKRSVTLVSHRMKMPGHKVFEVNATVVEKATQNLLSFANFSYHWLKSGSEETNKEVYDVGLKIPHYTWNIHAVQDESELERTVVIKLDRLRQVPGSEEEGEAGGWWDHTHEGHVEELTASYKGHVKAVRVENQLLPEAWRQSRYVENKEQRYRGYDILMDYEIKFPADGKEESITMKANSLRLYSDRTELPKRPTTYTDILQWLDAEASETVWNIHNTYRGDRRVIKTVTGARQGWVRRWISHEDNTYFGSGEETKYHMNLVWGEKERCEYADFKHGFSSSFFSIESNALLECKPRTKAYHIELNVKTRSEWDVLNSDLHQQFHLERHLEGWEFLNFTSPTLDVDATAKIGMDLEGPFYDKQYVFKSKTDLLPNSVLSINAKLTTTPYIQVTAEVPEEGIKQARLRTDVERDGSGLTTTGTHIHTSNPDEEHTHSTLIFKLLTPYKYSVRGYYNLKHAWAVSEWVHRKAELLREKIEDIRKDENHPLNRFKRRLLKAMEKDAEYWTKTFDELQRSRLEIRKLLYPFVEPTVETLTNIHEKMQVLRQRIRERYGLRGLPDYAEELEIRKHLRETLETSPHLLMDAAKSYIGVDRDNRIVRFSYTGPHGLYWESLLQPPQTFEGTWRAPILRWNPYLNGEILFRSRYIVPPFYKTAMIFGGQHMFTFDRKMYEFPDYPNPDCVYLLLHDVRDQSFSVMTSANRIHFLFPEMTVTIDSDERIRVNNSREQSEVPLESPNSKVSVKREGKIIVVDTVGLKALCDVPRFFCIFALDPLHHSGTIGLLGNADGEDYNDFELPDGKIVTTSAEMGLGYEVTGRKKCKPIREKEKPQWGKDVQLRCNNLFGSEYSACASFVEVEESLFKEACRWDVHQGNDVCSSPNALAGYCTVHGRKTKPCSPPQDWTLKTVSSAHKLEVIVVVDQHSSMFSKGQKGLESLLGAIDDEFKGKGYDSVLFAVIAFGGKGIRYHPHIQTPNAEIWHTRKDTIAFMRKTLEFSGQHRGNALEAMKYAATILPFDMQSSRVMLLLTVDDVDSMFAGLKVRYLYTLLESYSITLYTFADFPSIDKGKKVFGVRADGYVFPSSSRKESYMDVPTTEKAKLTSGTRGAIFLRRFIEENEPFAVFTLAAQEIHAKVGGEVSKCRKCVWKLNHWWDIQHECELSDDCEHQRK